MTAGSPAKLRETIISSLDDTAAAVDGLVDRLNQITDMIATVYTRLDRLTNIQDRLTDIENKLLDAEHAAVSHRDHLTNEIQTLDSTIDSLPTRLRDELSELHGPIEELAEEARRAERLEWMIGARDAMGRGRTIKLVM